MAAVATRPAASGASLPSTYTPRYRRYKKPPPPPMALPTLAASGDSIPCPPTRKPEEKEKGKRRKSTEAPGAAPPAAKPKPPARRSRTRGSQARPCFLGFLFTAPSTCFPYQRRLLSRHRAAHPFTDACALASGHPGEDAVSSPL
jgi:hypothetical protein